MNKKNTNNFYNKKLKSRARELRKKGTLSEVVMWTNILKARKLKGYQFYRQRPILNYIVDFYCKDLNLIIELDGITHVNKRKKDLMRQNKLEEHGFNVIRFPDVEVINYTDNIRASLITWIEKYENEHPEVHPPGPLQRGK